MGKIELKYLMNSLMGIVDQLSSSLDKQSQHISHLWEEIGEKNTLIRSLKYQNKLLKDRVLKNFIKENKDKIAEVELEKRIKEILGESVDH